MNIIYYYNNKFTYIYIHMILTADEDIEAEIIFINSLLGLIDFGTAVNLATDL